LRYPIHGHRVRGIVKSLGSCEIGPMPACFSEQGGSHRRGGASAPQITGEITMTYLTPRRVSEPSDDVTVYLVLNDHGKFGIAYDETDPAEADRESIIRNFLTGQYGNALRVVAFNTAEGWSRDVSRDIAGEVLEQGFDADVNLSEDTKAEPLRNRSGTATEPKPLAVLVNSLSVPLEPGGLATGWQRNSYFTAARLYLGLARPQSTATLDMVNYDLQPGRAVLHRPVGLPGRLVIPQDF
jgi:hypothetical protein